MPLRDSWLISGQGVASCDGRLAALAEDKGVLPCQLTGVVTALSSLTVHHSPSGPARKKAKWDIQLSTGGSSRDAIDVDGETEPPNSKRLHGASSARAAWRQFNGERGPALRTRWIGSFVFRLRHGREQVFEITNSSYDEGSKAKLRVDRIVFRVRNCAKDGGYEEWSSWQTLTGLGEYEDALLSQQLQRGGMALDGYSAWRLMCCEVQHGHWPCLGQCFGQLACRDSPPVWLEVGVLRGVVRALALPWVVLFFAGMMSCGVVAHPDGCAELKWHGRERRSQGSKHSLCAACWPWWLRCWTSEYPALQ